MSKTSLQQGKLQTNIEKLMFAEYSLHSLVLEILNYQEGDVCNQTP